MADFRKMERTNKLLHHVMLSSQRYQDRNHVTGQYGKSSLCKAFTKCKATDYTESTELFPCLSSVPFEVCAHFNNHRGAVGRHVPSIFLKTLR